MDKTNGNTNWWSCGANCVGGANRTDGSCGCACIAMPDDCKPKSKTNSDLGTYKGCYADSGNRDLNVFIGENLSIA